MCIQLLHIDKSDRTDHLIYNKSYMREPDGIRIRTLPAVSTATIYSSLVPSPTDVLPALKRTTATPP